VDAAERARVLALLQMTIMFVSAPFGWIAGGLSGISRNLPFVLNIALLILGIIATVLYYRKNKDGNSHFSHPGASSSETKA
jgi:hypothetical protein